MHFRTHNICNPGHVKALVIINLVIRVKMGKHRVVFIQYLKPSIRTVIKYTCLFKIFMQELLEYEIREGITINITGLTSLFYLIVVYSPITRKFATCFRKKNHTPNKFK